MNTGYTNLREQYKQSQIQRQKSNTYCKNSICFLLFIVLFLAGCYLFYYGIYLIVQKEHLHSISFAKYDYQDTIRYVYSQYNITCFYTRKHDHIPSCINYGTYDTNFKISCPDADSIYCINNNGPIYILLGFMTTMMCIPFAYSLYKSIRYRNRIH